jgi:hypothetical protein
LAGIRTKERGKGKEREGRGTDVGQKRERGASEAGKGKEREGRGTDVGQKRERGASE